MSTNNTLKFWTIKNTESFGANKQALKAERKALNLAAGVDEAKTSPDQWPYRVVKGPDHPSIKPFFREISLEAVFRAGNKIFRKISRNEAIEMINGIDELIPKAFDQEAQYILA